MVWLFNSKYQLKKKVTKNGNPHELWYKCKTCHQVFYLEDFNKNNKVCLKCDFHDRLTAKERIDLLIDHGSFIETNANLSAVDALDFFDGTSLYSNKLKTAKQKSLLNDAVLTGYGNINNLPVNIAAMDFAFMGGSMGSVVGEKITRTIERATKHRTPVIIVSSSGGARMQEGILSLMQMAKTSAALKKHSDAGFLYLSVLTNPTTGGVTASFAMLGDIIISEPQALIGFAGPRVISQTIKQKLPENFQKAEFLQEHGFVDIITHRNELKNLLSKLIFYAD
ncbi:MAG: acetyl-CoA carboxylase, carboxyltransferase subunit beta [Brevinemataceae bacterium]